MIIFAVPSPPPRSPTLRAFSSGAEMIVGKMHLDCPLHLGRLGHSGDCKDRHCGHYDPFP